MGELTPSFLADISKYEDTLAKDPDSFCFAPLAELYRKNGLIDEAIMIAKKGCDRHPSYVGGFLALGRSYFEKGLMEESKAALEKVISATPENHLAQKLLSQVYLQIGDASAAAQCLKVLLAANPDDIESRELLDSLKDDCGPVAETSEVVSDAPEFSFDTEVVHGTALEYELSLDDVEIIEDLVEEVADTGEGVESPGGDNADAERKDPLKTATLAELYVSQGFLSSACSIYQELLITDPGNTDYERRLSEISQLLAAQEQPPEETAVKSCMEKTPEEPSCEVPSSGAGDCFDAVAILEKWLQNIQRRH